MYFFIASNAERRDASSYSRAFFPQTHNEFPTTGPARPQHLLTAHFSDRWEDTGFNGDAKILIKFIKQSRYDSVSYEDGVFSYIFM